MKLLSSPLVWLPVVVLIGICIGVVVMFARRRDPGLGADEPGLGNVPGFRDYVQNPELWKELKEAQGRVGDDIDAASQWNDEQVAAAVRRYVFDAKSSRESWADARVLATLKTRTHATLLDLLREPSLHSKLVTPTGEDLLSEAPFNRICDLLADDPPVEAVALLAPFLKENSDGIRKSAALTIGSTGAEPIVAPIRMALQDDDEYVRSYALMGLQRAMEGERLSDVCMRELFDDIQRQIADGKDARDAARLLLEFDEQRATEFLCSNAIFTPNAASLHNALSAMNAKGVVVPREKLLSLIEQLKSHELKYPRT